MLGALVLAGFERHNAAVQGLGIYDLVALILLVVFYALEHRAPKYLLAFAAVCLAWSIYGFTHFAWIIGALQFIGAVVAVRRWYDRQGPSRGMRRVQGWLSNIRLRHRATDSSLNPMH